MPDLVDRLRAAASSTALADKKTSALILEAVEHIEAYRDIQRKLAQERDDAQIRSSRFLGHLSLAVNALSRADSFITNGIELGYITAADADGDPAKESPRLIQHTIALIRETMNDRA